MSLSAQIRRVAPDASNHKVVRSWIVVGKPSRSAWREGRIELPAEAQVQGQLPEYLPPVRSIREQLVPAKRLSVYGHITDNRIWHVGQKARDGVYLATCYGLGCRGGSLRWIGSGYVIGEAH